MRRHLGLCNTSRNKPTEEPWSRWDVNIRTHLKQMRRESADWFRVTQGRYQWQKCLVPCKEVHTKHDGLLPNSSLFTKHKHPEIRNFTLDNGIHLDSAVIK
jgi:hypothetical protein